MAFLLNTVENIVTLINYTIPIPGYRRHICNIHLYKDETFKRTKLYEKLRATETTLLCNLNRCKTAVTTICHQLLQGFWYLPIERA